MIISTERNAKEQVHEDRMGRGGGWVGGSSGAGSGALTGVEGTIPGAKADSALQATLLAANPSLTSFEYGPEAYDATIITALATA